MNTSKTAWINPWGDTPPPAQAKNLLMHHQEKSSPTKFLSPASPKVYCQYHDTIAVKIMIISLN